MMNPRSMFEGLDSPPAIVHGKIFYFTVNYSKTPLRSGKQKSGLPQIFPQQGATKKSNGSPVFYNSKTSNLQGENGNFLLGNQRVETSEGFQRIIPGENFF